MGEAQVAPVEEKAQRMGWVPQDVFKGDPEKWVSAERFVERGENELPIMRERMRKMDSTVVGLNNTIASMKDTFGEFQKHQKTVADRAYAKGMKDIVKQQREAAEAGDVDKFDTLEKEKDELVKDMPVTTQNKVDTAEATAEKELNDWVADGNQWYEDDLELRDYASTMSVFIQNQKKLSGTKLYNAVKKEVELRYPDKFENKNRKNPTAVIGDGEAPVKPGKQVFANLPKEAQAQCNKFIKDIPGFTKEQYVKDYEW